MHGAQFYCATHGTKLTKLNPDLYGGDSEEEKESTAKEATEEAELGLAKDENEGTEESEEAMKKDTLLNLDCEDCVEAEHGRERCPACDEFSPTQTFESCIKCGGRKECVVCCFDTGGGVCEDCNKYICGKDGCPHTDYCESCYGVFCADCRTFAVCGNCHITFGCFDCFVDQDENYFCNACHDCFCFDCKDSYRCNECEHFFCCDCKQSFVCESCNEVYCRSCRERAGICEDCNDCLCVECSSKCSECETLTCKSCSQVSACTACNMKLCADCRDVFHTCCCDQKGNSKLI